MKKPQQHCEHECVCTDYGLIPLQQKGKDDKECNIMYCLHDTRSRPAPVALFQIEPNSNNYTIGQIVEINENIQKQRAEAAAQAREDVLKELKQGRKVITLCGSVKFWDEYIRQNAILTLEGNIVFSCGLSLKEGYEDILIDLPLNDVKQDLDFIHLCKIDLSDEIFVINVGGYIGDSTKREIAYAESKGKKVKYLESLRTQEREQQ